MKETIENVTHQIFFDICGKKPTDIDIFFLEDIHFPKIEYLPVMKVYFPLPREINGHQIYEGIVFSDYETAQETIWSLFFASVCHAAGHAKVTDFINYQNWIKRKNQKQAYNVIDHIEDIKVNDFLEKSFPEYFQEIMKIDNIFHALYKKKSNNDDKQRVKQKFSEKYNPEILKTQNKLKEKIIQSDNNNDELIEAANSLYQNRHLVIEQRFPYTDRFLQQNKILDWMQNIKIIPNGIFEKKVQNFIDIWLVQSKRKANMQKKYGLLTHDLNFDKVDFAPENIGEYLRLKNSTHMFLKKMSSQIKTIPNIMDDNMPEDMGLLQMQAAIQAVAAQNNSIQIFEQDDYRRIEEEWAIVLDTSSSMRLKFDEMKKFAIVLGEAANDVNSKNGKWGFFIFNNNFKIVKDHFEKFDLTAKSRIGGIDVNGLSFIGDAVKLCSRILEKENIEKKYIFLITDGQQVGTLGNNKDMEEAVLMARKKGITVIAIGLPQGNLKIFNHCMPYENLRKTVSKFIAAYSRISDDSI